MEWGDDGRDVRESQKQNSCLACSSPAPTHLGDEIGIRLLEEYPRL